MLSFDCQVINKPAPKKELTEEEKSKKHVSQYVFAWFSYRTLYIVVLATGCKTTAPYIQKLAIYGSQQCALVLDLLF